MCDDTVRDGLSTSTIPLNPDNCENRDCNEDRRYGMHEDFYSYSHCRLRTRNIRLFAADQVQKNEKRTTVAPCVKVPHIQDTK